MVSKLLIILPYDLSTPTPTIQPLQAFPDQTDPFIKPLSMGTQHLCPQDLKKSLRPLRVHHCPGSGHPVTDPWSACEVFLPQLSIVFVNFMPHGRVPADHISREFTKNQRGEA